MTTEELDALVADHPDQIETWVGWLKAPTTTLATVQQMKTADLSKTFVSIPLKGDNDDSILKNYQAVEPDLQQINGGHIQLAGLNPLASELTGTIGEDQQRASEAPTLCRTPPTVRDLEARRQKQKAELGGKFGIKFQH